MAQVFECLVTYDLLAFFQPCRTGFMGAPSVVNIPSLQEKEAIDYKD